MNCSNVLEFLSHCGDSGANSRLKNSNNFCDSVDWQSVEPSMNSLLDWVRVPVGFGETVEEKWKREASERNKKRCKLEKLLPKVRPEDDPSHEDYEVACCEFARFNCQGTEPAGMICFPDGSCMKVWRCLTCGKIPEHPNAPPIQEYSDAEEGKEEAVSGFPFARQENFSLKGRKVQ